MHLSDWHTSADHYYMEILSSSRMISSITIGLDTNPFMPLSKAAFLSSSKALAVMAIIGTEDSL